MRFSGMRIGSLVTAGMVALIALGATRPQTAQFTEAQASSGRNTYLARCSYCHGADLAGVVAPALAGSGSNIPYVTPGFVYGYTSVYMPAGNAGTLMPEEYVNITAFLMQQNGRHPSSSRLTLKTIQDDQTPMTP
jgi:polar amino acid transport system substrate-binding protein